MGLFSFFRSSHSATVDLSSLSGFRDQLKETVIADRNLLTDPSLAAHDLSKLQAVHERLGLLVQLYEETATAQIALELRELLDADLEEKLELIRDLRDREESEVSTLLALITEYDPEPTVRKAAASALLYNADEETRSYLASRFFQDRDPMVQTSTIFALDPEHNVDHQRFLLDNFSAMTDGVLRRITIEILHNLRSQESVQNFFDRASFTDADQSYIASLS